MSSGCAPAIARRFRIQGESGSMQQQSSSALANEPSWKERMAIALARDIIDGERIISGAHTEISFAAAVLPANKHRPSAEDFDRLSHAAVGGDCLRSHGDIHVFRRSRRARVL